eukprot:XP_001700283.1 predicted protein [Chlamydomonas reinhardtii]
MTPTATASAFPAQPLATAMPPRPPKQASPSPAPAALASLRRSCSKAGVTSGGLGAPPRQIRWQQRLACVVGGHSASEAEAEEDEGEAPTAASASASNGAGCIGAGDLQEALATASVSQLMAALVSRLVGAVLAAPARMAAALLALLLSWVALAAAGSRAATGVVLDRTASVLHGLYVTAPARLLEMAAKAMADGLGAGTGAAGVVNAGAPGNDEGDGSADVGYAGVRR